MNILITSAGQRVSLVRAFQKELKALYPNSKVFTTDMAPQLSAACNVSDAYFKVKRVTDPSYINDLLQLCVEQDIRMIVPTIDTELLVLAENRATFEEKGIYVMVSELPVVDMCRDKRKTNSFFESRGIAIPKAIDKNNPSFPLFIKPYDGSLSSDNYIIHSKEELRDFHLTNEKFLFMEYLNKKEYDEFTVDMYFNRVGALCCIVPRKRILIRAGEINKGVTCKNVFVSYLKEKIGTIEGARGCLTGQFFLHPENGKIAAIEINARYGGGYPLSYRAGANYPKWMIQEYFQNQAVSYTDNWENNLLMLRYDDEVLVHDYKAN
ncbi:MULTISPECIES: ATP-grasp domain-containing protein [unclassified Paraflavitalea]|uniref:ATP-grasp domain-containing protein n=1 Tax=unclassified Paraflavitalea TaxID=2798305 RepID=UPI003D3271D3